MKNCIIFLTQSPVPILFDYACSFAKAFYELGYNITPVDFDRNDNFVDDLKRAINNETVFILSVNGNGYGVSYEDRNIYEYFDIPFIFINVDHMNLNAHSLSLKSDKMIYGLFDAADAYYVKKYFKEPKRFFFSPSAGLMPDEGEGIETRFNERKYDVMFCGMVYDLPSIRKLFAVHPDSLYLSVFDEAVNIALEDETATDLEAFEKAMLLRQVTAEYFGANFHTCLFNFSSYIRSHKRAALLNHLALNGVKVHCFGTKPQLLNTLKHPNFIIHDYLETPAYLDVLSNSKLVLNTSPLLGYGATERMFSGMLNGAAVVTDTNQYINEWFSDGENIIAYAHKQYGDLSERLLTYLGTPHKLEEIAHNGKRIARRHHTFLQRAKSILDMIETGHINMPDGCKV